MRKLIIIIALLFSGIAASIYTSKPAKCAWCPAFNCYRRCSTDCACVTIGGQSGGSCVSVQQAPNYLKHGYVELR